MRVIPFALILRITKKDPMMLSKPDRTPGKKRHEEEKEGKT
jgi:hypothetical protein